MELVRFSLKKMILSSKRGRGIDMGEWGEKGWDYHQQKKALSIERRQRARRERGGGAFYREETETGERRVGFSSEKKKKKWCFPIEREGLKRREGERRERILLETYWSVRFWPILVDSGFTYMAPTMQLLVLRPNPIVAEWSSRGRCSCTSLTLGFLDFIKFEKNVCCMFSSVVSLHFSCV